MRRRKSNQIILLDGVERQKEKKGFVLCVPMSAIRQWKFSAEVWVRVCLRCVSHDEVVW